jgi:hypothetical protein
VRHFGENATSRPERRYASDPASLMEPDQGNRVMSDRVEQFKDQMSDAANRVGSATRSAAAATQDTAGDLADDLRGHVREYPLVTLLIAAGVGWLIGRSWQ